MDNPFNRKTFAVASGIIFLFEIAAELWQRYTGYPLNNSPLLYRLLIEPAIGALGVCIVIWVWPKKKKK